jgi:HK97 family phage major capsid protein
MTYEELTAKIGSLHKDAGEIVTRNANSDEWPSDDRVKFDQLHAEIRKLGDTKSRIDLQKKVEEELSQSTRQTDPNEIRRQPNQTENRNTADPELADGAMRAWMLMRLGGSAASSIRPEWRSAAQKMGVDLNSPEYPFKLPAMTPRSTRREDMEAWEKRALTTTTTAGGYTIPNEMIRALEEAQLFYGGMRQVATIIRTETGATLPFPTVNETAVKGRILGINTQVTATDPIFGVMNLGAFKYSSDMVLVPEELLQDSGINMPAFLGNALGTRIARITNQHWTTGTGTTQPWGIVPRATARNLGTGTATSFGATTAATYQNLVGIVHAVDVAYRRNARWMMNDAILAIFAGLVDTTGRPIWTPSMTAGEPDRLLGYPVVVNNDMTGTLANLARSVVFGDLSSYYIREVRDVAVLSSRERFIDFHQTAFLAFGRYDGDLLNAGSNPVVAAVHQT